jgi:metal-sulfur cluster biosynthetic enzyme
MTNKAKITAEEVMEILQPIEDPEIHISVVDLGLIYDVEVSEDNVVDVTFTLTTPACPLGPVLVGRIQDAIMNIEGVKDVNAWLTFNPPWDPRTMASDEVKMQLGIW